MSAPADATVGCSKLATGLTPNSKTAGLAAAGLCIALIVPVLPPLVGWLAGWAELSQARLYWGLVVHWLIFAAVVGWVVAVERQSLDSIGVRAFRWWTVPLGLVAGAVILGASGILINVLHFSGDTRFAGYLLSQPWPTRLMLVITAGVFEETAYRGYALERLASLLGSKWAAGAITVLCFAFAHIPAVGLDHILPVLVVSTLITLLYLWRRDLVLNIVAHATVDAISLLVLPALVGPGPGPAPGAGSG
jgi:membrane protease YdiL (CAAX protease family)